MFRGESVVAEVTHQSPQDNAKELRESQRRYAQILEAVKSYAYSVEVRDGLPSPTWHSEGCAAVTGYAPEELASEPNLWIDMVHPDDREMIRRYVDRILANEDVPPIERRIRCKDGTLRWVQDTIVLHRNQAGRLVRYDGLVMDTTERKQMEDRFRRLFESAPDGMIVVDSNGQIILVNAQVEKLFGYAQRELLGQSVETLVPERFRGTHLSHRLSYTATLHSRSMGAHGDLYGVRKDGSEFPAEISLSSIGTRNEAQICAAIRDIGGRKRMEQTLREQEAQFLAAQQIQEHLLPDAPPRLPGFDIAGACYPAEFAAGDYFDFVPLSRECMGVVVADVSGHGIGPALLAASTQAHLRSLAETPAEIDEILSRINRFLIREAQGEHFVTLLLARLDHQSRILAYANAGHPSGYILDGAGRLRTSLTSTGYPLGIVAKAEFPAGDPTQLAPGDTVLLLTDGLLEAMSSDGDSFGTERTLDVFSANRTKPAAEIIRSIYQAVQEFTGGTLLVDDVTLVVIKVDSEAAG
ncbi:MAG: SpoIIE family protein phosphatase [Planctomycetes bacterium]|nr:SpoIIE family protein phosphatase [Planctomycetota bacterium]MBL7039506.1 SpoIIE family protein phosphatase [Pirellulaceae bacterium]